MRRGFTVLELLVASLLLAMLVTMLSMMFNQSSIAWRTGVAGVAELNDVRAKLGAYHDIQDDILPGIGDIGARGGASDNRTVIYRTVSLWAKDQRNRLRVGQRAFADINSQEGGGGWDGAPAITISKAMRGTSESLGRAGSGSSMSAFIVGVQSAGPNRNFGDEDDITNWPEEAE